MLKGRKMSYITKYLESLLRKKDSIHQAQTTNSIYYTIGNTIISVSDHFSNKVSSDIRIVQPLNSRTLYLVQIKEGANILQFSLKELKGFIQNYLFINQIKNNTVKVFESVAEVTSNKEQEHKSEPKAININNAKDLSSKAFTSDGYTWVQTVDKLNSIKKWKAFSQAKKAKLRALLLGKSLDEIITIMSDNVVRTLPHTKLEKYFSSKGW